MTNLVEAWYQNLANMPVIASPLRHEGEAWGEYRRHTGPALRFARVRIALAPGESLEIVDHLDQDKRAWLQAEQCYDQIAFGVLDVMMTALPSPVNAFRLTLLDVQYDEVTSVPMAFRLAAREAAKAIITEQVGHQP